MLKDIQMQWYRNGWHSIDIISVIQEENSSTVVDLHLACGGNTKRIVNVQLNLHCK